MRFLLKCVFWLGGVFLLMPGLTGKQTNTVATTTQLQDKNPAVSEQPNDPLNKTSPDLIAQWIQAGKTLQEITSFCDRNPALCAAGKITALQAGEQALTRAKDAYDRLSPADTVKPKIQQIPIPIVRPQ